MTMDKSLKRRSTLVRNRSVLTRAERIERLKISDRWKEGDSPLHLAKVRVYKLEVRKKKKKKEEEPGLRSRRPDQASRASNSRRPASDRFQPLDVRSP